MHDSDNEGTKSEVSLLDTEIHDSNLNLHKLNFTKLCWHFFKP